MHDLIVATIKSWAGLLAWVTPRSTTGYCREHRRSILLEDLDYAAQLRRNNGLQRCLRHLIVWL